MKRRPRKPAVTNPPRVLTPEPWNVGDTDGYRPSNWRAAALGGPYDGCRIPVLCDPKHGRAQSVMVAPGVTSGCYGLRIDYATGRACWRWMPADTANLAGDPKAIAVAALHRWRTELRANTRDTATLDLLWLAACCAALGLECERTDPQIATRAFTDAARLVREDAGAV